MKENEKQWKNEDDRSIFARRGTASDTKPISVDDLPESKSAKEDLEKKES